MADFDRKTTMDKDNDGQAKENLTGDKRTFIMGSIKL